MTNWLQFLPIRAAAATLLAALTGITGAPRAAAQHADHDGHVHAAPGPAECTQLLAGYKVRPTWKVAGVDYAVGVPVGSHLNDPLAVPIPGTAVDNINHLLRVTGNNVKLNGYDFSLHGGYCVYI